MATKVAPKQKFSGSELKLQKAAARNLVNMDQERFKEGLGEELYRNVVHFAHFKGDFEKSRVFKSMLEARESGTFIEFSEEAIPNDARFRFDPLFIVAIREIYRLFEEATLFYDSRRFNEIVVPTIRRIELFQRKIKSTMKI